MAVPSARAALLRFGPFELNSHTGELRKRGVRVRLPDQSFKVLLTLLEHSGELVTREELKQQLWAASTFVDFNHGLNLAVARLRQALGDDADQPRYVETLPRKGYRFLAIVEVASVAPPTSTRVRAYRTPVAVTTQATPDHHITFAGLQWRWAVLAVVMTVVIVMAIVVLQRSSRSPAFFSAAPLTSYPGRQVCPSFSPDGDRVAFAWDGGNQNGFDVYVKQIGPGAPVRLTAAPAANSSPAWSPDGRTIAFLRVVSRAESDIILIASLGGPERVIAKVTTLPPYYGATCGLLAWSRDSRWLLAPESRSPDAPFGLLLVSIDTGQKRALTAPPAGYDDLSSVISPDGRQLALVRHSGAASELYRVRLSPDLRLQGEPERLTFYNRLIASPAWTPDSRAILFTRIGETGTHSIWKLTLSHPPQAEPIPIATDNSAAISLSHDGSRLVYARRTVHYNIWRIGLSVPRERHDPEAAPAPFLTSTYNEAQPQFSPDGSLVAFSSTRSGQAQIWICERDGSNPRQITSFPVWMAKSPHWSTDGKRIVFHERRNAVAALFITDIEQGRPLQLLTGKSASNDFMPSWSHDGEMIYFGSTRSGDEQIWKTPARGGTAIQVTKQGGLMALESADGHSLFYTKDSHPGLWQVSLDGGDERQILAAEIGGDGTAAAVVKQGIYFIGRLSPGAGQRLAYLDLSTGRIQSLAEIAKPVEYGLAISPDERWVLYSQIDQLGSDLMLVENFH